MGMEYAGSGKNTGVGFLTEFWKKTYLDEYIREGGSKIKFVTGRTGAGKTFLTRTVVSDAKELGYMTAVLSAKSVWLHDFKEIYPEGITPAEEQYVPVETEYEEELDEAA